VNVPQQSYQIKYQFKDDLSINRGNHTFSAKHNLFLTYSDQSNTGLNDQATQRVDLTQGNFTNNRLILSNFSLNSALSGNVVNAFTAGYQYWNNLIDSPLKTTTVTFPTAIQFGTNVNVPQQSYQIKYQFKDDLSIN
jgi:fibronectin type 3 domain-containing protein